MKQDSKSPRRRAGAPSSKLRWQVLVIAACALVLGSCARKESAATDKAQAAPAATPAAPPAAPPKTSLGVMAGSKQADTAELQYVCFGNTKASAGTLQLKPGVKPDKGMVEFAKSLHQFGGICLSKEKPKKGNVFALLSFEGEGTRKLATDDYAVIPSRYIGMADKGSWLTDAQGKVYKPGLLAGAPSKTVRQLAFEIPADASGLTWHDGEAAFPLKP